MIIDIEKNDKPIMNFENIGTKIHEDEKFIETINLLDVLKKYNC